MSDLQIFLVLSGIVLITLAASYVCFALKTQFREIVRGQKFKK